MSPLWGFKALRFNPPDQYTSGLLCKRRLGAWRFRRASQDALFGAKGLPSSEKAFMSQHSNTGDKT
jgi:hypothetical protein